MVLVYRVKSADPSTMLLFGSRRMSAESPVAVGTGTCIVVALVAVGEELMYSLPVSA